VAREWVLGRRTGKARTASGIEKLTISTRLSAMVAGWRGTGVRARWEHKHEDAGTTDGVRAAESELPPGA